MAKLVLTDADVTINAVDLSDRVRSVSLSRAVNAVEASTMSTSSSEFVVGTDSWTIDLTFTQDFAASNVDDTLNTVFAGAAAVTVAILPTSAGVGATNPSFTGSAILTTFPLIDGSWGDLVESGISMQGTGTLTRAVV